jgi:gamma-glutamylcyclotransferase (GGCT)/AIG2-like uncharacterized protein YtfP
MEQLTATPGHLFVYGTLRSGAGGALQAGLMRRLRLAGPATIRGRLYDAGWHPAAVPSADPGDRITGELWAFDADSSEALLAALDEYEGIDAAHPDLSLFRRTNVAAEREDGMRVPAWVYVYNQPVESLPRITSGDWQRRASR